MAASEKTLSLLHEKQAQAMLKLLESDEPLPAATLQAITAFLKNNDITCVREEGDAMSEMEKKVQERQLARAKRAGQLSDRELDSAVPDFAVLN